MENKSRVLEKSSPRAALQPPLRILWRKPPEKLVRMDEIHEFRGDGAGHGEAENGFCFFMKYREGSGTETGARGGGDGNLSLTFTLLNAAINARMSLVLRPLSWRASGLRRWP